MTQRSRRRSPFVVASALVQATTKAVAAASLDLVEEVAAGTGRSLARSSERASSRLGRAGHRVATGELGLGPVRVRPSDVEWVRRQVATGLRSLLLVPEETAERLRTADPTTMARTVLALVGGDEALVPLPTPEDQIRQRFRALLDPDADDRGTLAPALLTITAQLSPDEARILRHVATVERAVVVAVDATSRTTRTGPTVARHLSVLVERSGGDHPSHGPAYLDDLVRLGLCSVDWARDDDHPDVALIEQTAAYDEAMTRVRRDGARPRRRIGSLGLTELGRRLVSIGVDPPAAPGLVAEPPPVPITSLGEQQRSAAPRRVRR